MKPITRTTDSNGFIDHEEPNPQEINVLVTLFKQARYSETENLAQEMTVRFPKHGFGWKALGTALIQQGRTLEALVPLQKAIELSQGDAQLHNNLGNALAKLDRLPEAEASYRQALRLNPGFVEAHHNLGNILLKLDRLHEAEASHRRALEFKPDFAEAHNNLGNTLLAQDRLHEAEASFRRALQFKPDCAEAYLSLGNALFNLGQLDGAEASYRRALEINPYFSKAYNSPDDAAQNFAVKTLMFSIDPDAQEKAIRVIKGSFADYQIMLLQGLMKNPFLVLPSEDRINLQSYVKPHDTQSNLLLLRQLSTCASGRRCCVFCMPKSGSSFVKSAIQFATKAPFVMLTHCTYGSTSLFGMNGRMQELDELAIMNASGDFVAQHHTRCTPFLAAQLKFFKIRPIVTTRNIYDCLVSADDMLVEWRNRSDWISDGAMGSLPAEFTSLAQDKRLELLSYGIGVWLIDFYLSWRRCERQGYVHPLWVKYEQDVVGERKLGEKLGAYLNMDNAEQERLSSFIESPNKKTSRLNKGVSGRGVEVPEHIKIFLKDYASNFGSELNNEDFLMLFGDY